MTSFLAGMGQILVEPGCPQANLNRAVDVIRQAASQGCRLVVLPECLDLGWGSLPLVTWLNQFLALMCSGYKQPLRRTAYMLRRDWSSEQAPGSLMRPC